jgi:uncharacterized membrane protein
MVVLAALVHLSTRAVTVFGLVMILAHNALDGVDPSSLGIFSWPWQVLHVPGLIEYLPGWTVFLGYPLVPWIGVMATGYGFGSLLLKEPDERNKLCVRIGAGAIAAFVLLRAVDIYGDSNHWASQKTFVFTFLDFLDTTKYPPSLLFLLMTLGPAILLLPLFDRVKGPVARFFVVFGRVPMFFYLIHIPFIHALAVAGGFMTGFDIGYMFSNTPPWFWPEGYGFGLPVVYLVWAGVVVVLYFPCKRFADLKRRRKDAWLSYL